MYKTAIEVIKEHKNNSVLYEGAKDEMERIRKEKKLELIALTESINQKYATKEEAQKKINYEYMHKNQELSAEIRRIKMPFKETVEKIISILYQTEGKEYKLIASEEEWLKSNRTGNGYEKMYCVYLKKEKIRLFNETIGQSVDQNKSFYMKKCTIDELKEKDGVIVLYTQKSSIDGEKIKLNIPSKFIFGASSNYNDIALGLVLMGKYEYIIEKIAETTNIKKKIFRK